MRSFDLNTIKESRFYKKVLPYKGTLLIKLETIETLLQTIEEMIEDAHLYTKEGACRKLQNKIIYAQQCVDILLTQLSNNLPYKLKNFLYDKESYPKGRTFYEAETLFTRALPEMSDYLLAAKCYLVEAEMQIKENIDIEDLLGPQSKHTWAISQSLLPSAQSMASLFIAHLKMEIEKDPTFNMKNAEEVINDFMNKSAKKMAEYLYSEEDGVTVNLLKGMREHYIQQLSAFEKLYNDNLQLESSFKQLQNENQRLQKAMEAQETQSSMEVQCLKEEIKHQQEEMDKKEKNMKNLTLTLEQLKGTIVHKQEKIESMDVRIDVLRHVIDNQVRELALLKSKLTKKENDSARLVLTGYKKNPAHSSSLLVGPGFFPDSTAELRSALSKNTKEKEDKQANCLDLMRKKG